MFKKILIANRGEIACRVMRTARNMGIATVAVYSEADRNAPHVALADESVCIGPPPATESYLLGERILEACRDTGAEAVHPGYGFLSENAAFADQLARAGIEFIGPRRRAIEAMGDKITSKKIAGEAGVNVIPGHTGVVPDADAAVKIAGEIGYPVMIKASAGGGGKGMRVAANEQECREGFERATSEALSSFADGRVFIEKFVDQPRHIEIQVIADAHGNTLYLNERECSIQRRHQKIIEEAPSVFIDPKTRAAMGAQAVALAEAVEYRSAGTVEFIVDGERNFYFLEMNTRLQVEHPVTELITGLDLVELMIRVAAGEPLGISQDEVGINGWAMESRIYAENPRREFLPSTGRIRGYREPHPAPSVRVDSGVEEGASISMYYDPMIAKLVTWGPDREAAIQSMSGALDQYHVRGVDTNICFVSAIMTHPRFREGRLTTNFIAEEYPDGFSAVAPEGEQRVRLVCVMTALHYRLTRRAATVSGQNPGYERQVASDYSVLLGGSAHDTRVARHENGWEVEHQGEVFLVEDDWDPMQVVYRGRVNGEPVYFQVRKNGYGYDVEISGNPWHVQVLGRETAELMLRMPVREAPDLSRFLLSPMPGLLVSLAVEAGQAVKSGQALAVIEAMKMENTLRAENDGVVARVLAEPGSTLEVDQPILEFGGDHD